MINLYVTLDNVPYHLLKNLGRDLEDVQRSYNLITDTTINNCKQYVCIDIESTVLRLTDALNSVLELLTDNGLCVFVKTIEVV